MLGFGQRSRGNLLGVVDIGTSKIVCLAVEARWGRRREQDELVCLGIGHQRSAGVRGGVVVDPVALEDALRSTIAAAERNARQRFDEVYVSASCGRLGSRSFAAHADVATGAVSSADIERLYDGAIAYAERDGRTLLHLNRKAYRLDGAACGEDPRGMAARRVTADLHAVTADEGPLRNLMHTVERSHLSVRGLVAAPYAAGLAVTSPEERELGVTVIDFGGGTTGIAIFAEGHFVHCEVLATGGHHLTFEIAKNFQAPLVEAERIKTLYASMVNAQSDLSDRFSYALAVDADGAVGEATRAELSRVVEPRVADLLAMIAARRSAVGAGALPVVLTGGGSQLFGLREYAASVLGCEVRSSRTRALPGMPSGSDSPVFAAAVGLAYAAVEGSRVEVADRSRGGYFAQVRRWLAGGL